MYYFSIPVCIKVLEKTLSGIIYRRSKKLRNTILIQIVEHSRRLQKRGIPASSLQLIPGDISPETEAAGSTGVFGSDSSCPTNIYLLITFQIRFMLHADGTA